MQTGESSRRPQDSSVFSLLASSQHGLSCNRTPNPKCVPGVFSGHKPKHPNPLKADHSGRWQGEPTQASLLSLDPSGLRSMNCKILMSERIGLDMLISSFPGTLPIQKPVSWHPGNKTSHFLGRLEDAYRPSAVTFIKSCKRQEDVKCGSSIARSFVVAKTLWCK